jgi:hypothetical protein
VSGELKVKVSGTIVSYTSQVRIAKSVGLIYQRREVHGSFATDSLSLR